MLELLKVGIKLEVLFGKLLNLVGEGTDLCSEGVIVGGAHVGDGNREREDMNVRHGQVMLHEVVEESIERGVRVKVEAGIGLGEEAPHLFHDIKGDLCRGGGAAWIALMALHCCWWGRFRDDLVVLRLGKVFPKAVIFRK